jgi:hypothetical protein
LTISIAIGEFSSQGADEPFGKAVRLWATWGNSDHLDAHIGENSVERGGELAGPVAHEESKLGDAITQIHHEVAELLGGPSTVGMGGRAQQMYRSAGQLQDEEHIDPLKRHHAVHVEEVAGQQGRRLRAQKLPPGRVGAPGRCWRYPQPLHHTADRGRSHAMAELE